jgi:hypothetical protein
MKNVSFPKITGVALLMASVSVAFAQGTLSISQPLANTGVPVTSWAWQSFTVAQTANITTFGIAWNGASGNLNATATVDLLSGEGTGGTVLGSTTGSVVYLTAGPYAREHFFVANFGSIELTPGQYTAYFHGVSDTLQFVGTAYDSYNGGKLVSSTYGDTGWDASFFTPAPVPEPSFSALGILGLVCIGGVCGMKQRGRKLAA